MSSNRRWQCPYYIHDRDGKVVCEAARLALLHETYRGYIETYCGDLDGWRRCTLARALNAQYEKEED